jgi:hypothetical protein
MYLTKVYFSIHIPFTTIQIFDAGTLLVWVFWIPFIDRSRFKKNSLL